MIRTFRYFLCFIIYLPFIIIFNTKWAIFYFIKWKLFLYWFRSMILLFRFNRFSFSFLYWYPFFNLLSFSFNFNYTCFVFWCRVYV